VSFEFACTFKRETDAAVLVYDHANEEEHWIPLSQVEEMHKDRDGRGTIVVTDWIAQQKGLT
jgi:hypothetical protein